MPSTARQLTPEKPPHGVQEAPGPEDGGNGRPQPLGTTAGLASRLRYVWNVGGLWFQGLINLQTLRRALQDRPIAVAGKRGNYIVDPDFE